VSVPYLAAKDLSLCHQLPIHICGVGRFLLHPIQTALNIATCGVQGGIENLKAGAEAQKCSQRWVGVIVLCAQCASAQLPCNAVTVPSLYHSLFPAGLVLRSDGHEKHRGLLSTVYDLCMHPHTVCSAVLCS
jgi:hypothetical protein